MASFANWWITLASFGFRLASRILIRHGPFRLLFSLATSLVREGVKVKVDTWVNEKRLRGKAKFLSGMKLTFKRTIRWAKKKKSNPTPQAETMHDFVALDAGLKYKELAERRLRVAREAFEAAAVELKAADRGLQDAERYVNSLRSHCCSVGGLPSINDFVLVEHSSCQNMDEVEQASTAIVPAHGNGLDSID